MKYQNGTTVEWAVKTLNYYGRERLAAYAHNMDWMPSAHSRIEMRDAVEVLKTRKNPDAGLTTAGKALLEVL